MRLSGTVVLVLLLGLLAFILSPSIAAETPDNHEWPTFQCNWARTGYADASLPGKLELLWEFPSEEGMIRSRSTPAVAGRKVYFTAENMQDSLLYIYALDAENGSLMWSYRGGRDAGAGRLPSPTVASGRVYVGDENYLYAFDAESGERIWRFEVPWEGGLHGVDSAPVVTDNKVYFGSWDGWFYCVDANTGELIWEYSDGDGEMGHVMGAPAVIDGAVYFGTGAGSVGYTGWVYALNAENGAPIWRYHIGDEISSSPAVVDNIVYIGAGFMGHLSGDGMWAFDAKTGEVLWYFDTENEPVSSPAVAHSKVCFGSNDGYVYALSAENGSVVWKYYLERGIAWNPPVVIGNRVILGTRSLYVFDAETGELLSSRLIGAAGYAPAFAYGKIYIATWYPGGLQAWAQAPAEVLHEGEPTWWALAVGAVSIIGAIILVWRKLAKT